jgi:hypothetical protein
MVDFINECQFESKLLNEEIPKYDIGSANNQCVKVGTNGGNKENDGKANKINEYQKNIDQAYEFISNGSVLNGVLSGEMRDTIMSCARKREFKNLFKESKKLYEDRSSKRSNLPDCRCNTY